MGASGILGGPTETAPLQQSMDSSTLSNDSQATIPYDENFKWKMGSLFSGASLSALNDLANSKDYYLVALDSSCVNAFFIRGDLKHNFEILDPLTSFKKPLKYNKNDIEIAKQELLKQNLVFQH